MNSFRSSHGPALQGSSSGITFSGNHSSHVLCKKKGTCWVPSLYAQTWTPIILTEARFYKKYETIVFMTQMANKKEVWFPCQGGRSGTLQTFPGEWLIQYSDLRWRSMWLGLDCHKRHLGLTFCQADPWRTCSVCGFTGLCSLFSWEALRRKTLCRCDWCVVPWAPPRSPVLPLPCALPLSYHMVTVTGQQVTMQSDNVWKLFLFPSQPPYTNGSQYPVLAL